MCRGKLGRMSNRIAGITRILAVTKTMNKRGYRVVLFDV